MTAMTDHDALAEEIVASGLFHAEWYRRTYPDVDKSGLDPLMHFVRFGMLMKRNPGPGFDSRFYLVRYADVAKANVPALLHYLRFGKTEGRAALPAEAAAQDADWFFEMNGYSYRPDQSKARPRS